MSSDSEGYEDAQSAPARKPRTKPRPQPRSRPVPPPKPQRLALQKTISAPPRPTRSRNASPCPLSARSAANETKKPQVLKHTQSEDLWEKQRAQPTPPAHSPNRTRTEKQVPTSHNKKHSTSSLFEQHTLTVPSPADYEQHHKGIQHSRSDNNFVEEKNVKELSNSCESCLHHETFQQYSPTDKDESQSLRDGEQASSFGQLRGLELPSDQSKEIEIESKHGNLTDLESERGPQTSVVSLESETKDTQNLNLPPIYMQRRQSTPSTFNRPMPFPRKRPLQATKSSNVTSIPELQSKQKSQDISPKPISKTPDFGGNTIKRFVKLSEGIFPLRPTKSTGELVTSSEGPKSPIRLSELVSEYGHRFPMDIEISKGLEQLCGTSFVAGERYHVHFVKNTEVLVATLSGYPGNESYTIPHNSPLQLCPVYNPENNLERAKQGYKFQSVEELMKASTLPSAVTATRVHEESNPNYSIMTNEVLLLKKKKKNLMHEYIQAFSMLTRTRKKLKRSCKSRLTTEPLKLGLYLPDFVEHFGSQLPTNVLLQAPPSLSHLLPFHVTAHLMTISPGYREVSLVVTPTRGKCQLIEIPISADLLVTTTKMITKEKRHLVKLTSRIIANLDMSQVVQCRENPLQSVISALVRPLHEHDGVGFELSDKYHHISRLLASQERGEDGEESDEMERDWRVWNEGEGEREHLEAGEIEPLYDTVGAGVDYNDHEYIWPDEEGWRQDADTELEPYASLKFTEVLKMHGSNSPEHETNKSELNKLSIQQILSLLDKMELGQYKEHFRREQINGSVLLELDEAMLEESLGVATKLHRRRILRLIEGKDSAIKMLSRVTDNYVTTVKSSELPPIASGSIHEGNTSQYEQGSSDGRTGQKKPCDLDREEILSLLDKMELGQYKEHFRREQINGSVLLELDEAMLEESLGVATKLHRRRILRLIEGKDSELLAKLV